MQKMHIASSDKQIKEFSLDVINLIMNMLAQETL